MATVPSSPVVEFPASPEGRAELEAPDRGYLSDVIVRSDDGAAYRVCFYDPVRLQQTLEDDASTGRPFFAESGLIVLPLVTTDAIKKAVSDLWREGFFHSLKPL